MEVAESKKKLYIKRGLCLTSFLLGLILIYLVVDYVFFDETQSMTRVSFHEYYNLDDVDILVLGPSHCIYTIDANMMSEELGESVFNMSTSDMHLNASYMLMEEAIRLYHPRKIFFEVSLSRLAQESMNPISTQIVADYIKTKRYKYELLLSLDTDNYVNAFLRAHRNINPLHLPRPTELAELHKKKQSSAFLNYEGDGTYLGRGLWANYDVVYDPDHCVVNIGSRTINGFGVEDIQQEQVEYIRKIVQLCRDNDVELTFFTPPYSPIYLQLYKDYDEVTDYIYNLADELDVPLIDMNLVHNEYLSLSLSDFYNPDHVGTKGGKEISKFLVQYIRDPDGNYFYKDRTEKSYDINDVYAIGYKRFYVTEDGEEFKKIKQAEKHGVIDHVRLLVQAFGYQDVPASARVWYTSGGEVIETEGQGQAKIAGAILKQDDSWVRGEEIPGTALDAYTTEFILPYDYKFELTYDVELTDPATGKVIRQAITKFDAS